MIKVFGSQVVPVVANPHFYLKKSGSGLREMRQQEKKKVTEQDLENNSRLTSPVSWKAQTLVCFLLSTLPASVDTLRRYRQWLVGDGVSKVGRWALLAYHFPLFVNALSDFPYFQ
ncbi:unnamed protein product [Linum trigynum]|uniref:Uncharacterized protein n=1 Tax=Linum trigynum TaxID=586398 RepID=A0AAV2ESA9_9ROSI